MLVDVVAVVVGGIVALVPVLALDPLPMLILNDHTNCILNKAKAISAELLV